MAILRRALKLLGLAVLGSYLVISIVGAKFLVDGSMRPQHMLLRGHTPPQPWLRDAAYQRGVSTIEITAKDGARLRAWYLMSGPPARGAAILLHGLGDDRAGMAGQAELLLRDGYNVLLPDSRAHGDSEGAFISYGVLEADDVHRWVDWLESNRATGAGNCVFGVGVSMGAAVILQSLNEEHRFCGVIAESSFATFREIAYDRIGQPFGLGPWLGKTVGFPLIEFGMIYARLHYGIDFDRASPKTAVTASSTPILLIHGLADSNIPPYHAQLLSAANRNIQLWEPAGVQHGSAITDAPAEYKRRVTTFLQAHSRGFGTLRTAAASQ